MKKTERWREGEKERRSDGAREIQKVKMGTADRGEREGGMERGGIPQPVLYQAANCAVRRAHRLSAMEKYRHAGQIKPVPGISLPRDSRSVSRTCIYQSAHLCFSSIHDTHFITLGTHRMTHLQTTPFRTRLELCDFVSNNWGANSVRREAIR